MSVGTLHWRTRPSRASVERLIEVTRTLIFVLLRVVQCWVCMIPDSARSVG